MHMLALVIAGEIVFLLPFMLPRLFRSTYLDVFGLTNLEFGVVYSVFGIIALVSYFFGGLLADLFAARKLITAALLLTGIGGLFLSAIPQLGIFISIYGFWGITTSLLLWAALHRATREWGGIEQQGLAFGILEGGRGAISALLASLVVAVFAFLLPLDVLEATFEQRTEALSEVIQIFSVLVIAVALLVWFFVPETNAITKSAQRLTKAAIFRIARIPAIWLQGIVVFSAYVTFKIVDYFSLYATEIFGYDEVAAGQLIAILFWIRPVAALGAGFLGDFFKSSQVIIWSFMLLIIGSFILTANILPLGIYWLLLLTLSATSVGIYALRGVYFALFEEVEIPRNLTGTTVGLISIIGFMPDFFISPLLGYLIDQSPGIVGYQQVFGLLLVFSVIGLIAILLFQNVTKKKKN